MTAASHRDCLYPLNVLMHVLMLEEGHVEALHYGLFNEASERIAAAQDRSTEMLMSRLPPPPARVLDVGSGLGTTLTRLLAERYDAEGITPDASQVAIARDRYGDAFPVRRMRFEDVEPATPFDVVVFQESAQYIDSRRLFETARRLTRRVLVLDEFALTPVEPPNTLHSRAGFLDAAAVSGFRVHEEIDLSSQALPTVDYFLQRIPRHAGALKRDLGVTDLQVSELIESGNRYRQNYANGTYGYRLMDLRCN